MVDGRYSMVAKRPSVADCRGQCCRAPPRRIFDVHPPPSHAPSGPSCNTPSVRILVLNVGSSSIKFQLIDTDAAAIESASDRRLARGVIERIGGEAIVTL